MCVSVGKQQGRMQDAQNRAWGGGCGLVSPVMRSSFVLGSFGRCHGTKLMLMQGAVAALGKQIRPGRAIAVLDPIANFVGFDGSSPSHPMFDD